MSEVAETQALHRTPFHEFHVGHGARLVPFAGWEMPMLYRSILEEHRQVRSSGGFFDVSHMGRVRFTGGDARRFLDRVCTRTILGMADGQCRYMIVCNEQGGCRDDGLVYRVGEDDYLMVCNAANREKLLGHFAAERGDLDFDLRDETFDTAMIALQGPKVMDLIGSLAPDVPALKRYRFVRKSVFGVDLLISRTGYTGEDGVEVILPAAAASQAVGLLAGNVSATGPIQPAGLGARDTLRLEAAMPLYGHEITESIDPVSAGLDFAVKLDKSEGEGGPGRFVGQAALQAIAERGPRQKLCGLILEGKRTARQGMKVTRAAGEIGFVTSACLSPTLDRPIALAYVDAGAAAPGGTVAVDLGRASTAARITELPFYKR